MGIIYSKCYNGVIMVPGFADESVACKTGPPVGGPRNRPPEHSREGACEAGTGGCET